MHNDEWQSLFRLPSPVFRLLLQSAVRFRHKKYIIGVGYMYTCTPIPSHAGVANWMKGWWYAVDGNAMLPADTTGATCMLAFAVTARLYVQSLV